MSRKDRFFETISSGVGFSKVESGTLNSREPRGGCGQVLSLRPLGFVLKQTPQGFQQDLRARAMRF
jgi:hypothetical protein